MGLPPLYKFLNVKCAILTLGTRTFKHSSPSDFNDTEDLTIQSIFPEETEAALKRLVNGFTDIILQHRNDPPTCSAPNKDKVVALQRAYLSNPEAAALVRAKLAREGGKKAYDMDYMRERSKAFVNEINEFMQGYRVLCVTTNKDSEEMWSSYAENHKGIALRIEPNLTKDSKFQLFRPVIYREKRPPLYKDTLEFMAGALFGNLAERCKSMIERIAYTKTLEWEHGSEYRLVIGMLPDEEPWNTNPYHAEEITELYLGLAVTQADKDQIVGMAQSVNPNITIFAARRGAGGALEFDRIQ